MSGATPLLSTDLRDKIAHAIGHPTAKGCSVTGGRNYYCGAADDPDWSEAVERGLAIKRECSLIGSSVYYHVTVSGRAALEHDVALDKGDPS